MRTKSLTLILALISLFQPIANASTNFTTNDGENSIANITSTEDCFNGIDDDGDGLIDCADPDCHAQDACRKPFNCPTSAYLFQGNPTGVYEVDLASGNFTTVATNILPGKKMNAFGYNIKDGYFWANPRGNDDGDKIARVDSNFNVERFTIDGLPTLGYFVGDVDSAGIYHLYNSGNGGTLTKVDVNPYSETYLEVVEVLNVNLGSIHDFAFNPIDNQLYTVRQNSNKLLKVNPATGAVTDFGAIPAMAGINSAFGAVYFANDGSFYVSTNQDGIIYKIDSTHLITNNATIQSAIFAYGPASSVNDGAMCTAATVAQEICNNGIDDDGDGLTDCEDPACGGNDYQAITRIPFDDAADNWSAAWGDYDGDGYIDIFIPAYDANETSLLYKNNGDGTFTKITSGNVVTDLASSTAATWGDYDRDGDLDLFVANNIGSKNFLYRNDGNGTFTSILNDPIVNDLGYAHGVAWADYNNDGYLDMFTTSFFSTQFNNLYKNNGDGTFSKVTSSSVVTDAASSVSCAWADYDSDGDQDLFVCNTNDENNFLYRNDGGTFTKITTGAIVSDGGKSTGASWGDYDNDLDLDLFVTNAGNQDNFLYQNNGDGTFSRITTGDIVNNGGHSHGSVWIDYNNDGDLDLFVTNDANSVNYFYSNNGDGTFTRINNLMTLNGGDSFGSAVADYDNDGDLDVFVANHSGNVNQLYANDAALCGNHVCFTLVGTASNTTAIGAKIYILTTVNGVETWQMRDVSALTGGGIAGQSDLRAFFGVGIATEIDSIVVEWPSGFVQKLGAVDVGDCHTITEPNGSILSGTVYYDVNANCVQDNDEIVIPNIEIVIQPGNVRLTTDENGFYSVSLAPGIYTVEQNLTNNWSQVCPNNNDGHVVNITNIGSAYSDFDFFNMASCPDADLSVNLATTALRVGFEGLYAVTYANNGAGTATGTTIAVDFGEHIKPLSASLPWASVADDVYTWNIGTVNVGEQVTIYVVDSVLTTATIGNSLTVEATISSAGSDCNDDDNAVTDINITTGSIDPNDIKVTPEGYIEKTQELTYRIRFQNVGNDIARTVIVRDELPEGLDINTLIRGTTSHAHRFHIEGERTLVWTFENINLIDSTTNEPESHGFIYFKIKPQANIAYGTELPNQAAIFFDANDPIITNTVINTIGTDADVQKGTVGVFPNPMADYTMLQIASLTSNQNQEEMQSISIYNTHGQLIREINGLTGKRYRLNRGRMIGGYYFVKVYSNKGNLFMGKLLVR